MSVVVAGEVVSMGLVVSIISRAVHRPFYGYGRHITAVEISSKISTVRPGTITAVNGYYGRFRVMTPMSCE